MPDESGIDSILDGGVCAVRGVLLEGPLLWTLVDEDLDEVKHVVDGRSVWRVVARLTEDELPHAKGGAVYPIERLPEVLGTRAGDFRVEGGTGDVRAPRSGRCS